MAGLPLLFAHLKFFALAGTFLVFVASFGLFFAFFQLIPLLMVVGPTDSCGDIYFCLRSKGQKAVKDKRTASEHPKGPVAPPTAEVVTPSSPPSPPDKELDGALSVPRTV